MMVMIMMLLLLLMNLHLSLVVFHWLKPLTDEGWEETLVPEENPRRRAPEYATNQIPKYAALTGTRTQTSALVSDVCLESRCANAYTTRRTVLSNRQCDLFKIMLAFECIRWGDLYEVFYAIGRVQHTMVCRWSVTLPLYSHTPESCEFCAVKGSLTFTVDLMCPRAACIAAGGWKCNTHCYWSAADYNGRYAMAKKKKKKKKGKADLTTVLHIRELPHLHMKLAVWFSFPTSNNKNPMIPSWSLVSIYNYSFNPDQIFTKNFEILELEMCSQIFTCGMRFLQVNSSLPTSLKKYVLSH